MTAVDCGHGCCADPGDPMHRHLAEPEDCDGCRLVTRIDQLRERMRGPIRPRPGGDAA